MAEPNITPVPPPRFKRFGFAGLCFLVALVIFGIQQGCSMVAAQPSWIAGLCWFTTVTILLVMGIWLWDRTAKVHWYLRLIGSFVAMLIVVAFSYGPIKKQYRIEHPVIALPVAPPEKSIPELKTPTPPRTDHDSKTGPATTQSRPSAPIILQHGQSNIAQVGNNNTASINAVPEVRTLTEAQKEGIAAFLNRVPPEIDMYAAGVQGSGDSGSYASEFLQLFRAAGRSTQPFPATRVGLPSEFIGVFVVCNPNSDAVAKYRSEFVDTLQDVGVNAHQVNDSSMMKGHLMLQVGFRPEEVRRR